MPVGVLDEPSYTSSVSDRLPAILAIALLAAQLVLPWTVRHFVTQDGPSHVYSAVTARDLLVHRHSIQRTLYHFRPAIVPNWTSTILLAIAATVAGVGNAERVMVDAIILLGFFSFRYASRSLSDQPLGFLPLANFLFHTWFLWLGFFNFALGMALCPALIGYFVRRRHAFGLKQAALIMAASVFLFFTHLIPAAVAVLAILTIALWTRRNILHTTVAVAPVIVLTLIYSHGKPHIEWKPDVESALAGFPMHVFATAAGTVGGQVLLGSGVLLCIAVTLLGLRPKDWRSEKGALAVAALICFLLYLFVPDQGLGGSETKIRLAWAVFILGGLVTASGVLKPLEAPLAIYISLLLGCNLLVTWQALRLTSRAVEDYIAATDRIPKGAVFVRIHYPTPRTTERYGLTMMGRDPFFHLDAYSASRAGSVDLSDYEGVNPIFPLALRPRIREDQQYALWALEGPGEEVAGSLTSLHDGLAVPIEYVVLVTDGDAQELLSGLSALNAKLASETRLFSASPGNFVRVYQYMR